MTKEESVNVKEGDVLWHNIFNRKIVVTKIITQEDKKSGQWIGDVQYRFEDEDNPFDTENWLFVSFVDEES